MGEGLDARAGFYDEPLAGVGGVGLAVVFDAGPAFVDEPCGAVGEFGEAESGTGDLGSLCDVAVVAPEEVQIEVQPVAIEHGF